MPSSSAATIIPERLRDNPGNFVFLDINVDSDFDKKSFQDLIFSFRHNYTLRYITLVRSSRDDMVDDSSNTNYGKQVVQRSTKELRLLVREILRLPKLEVLDFENFTNSEISHFEDLLTAATRVQ